MSKLDDILGMTDADELTGELQGLILTHKPDETTWSWPERLVVILCSMERWVGNGGFEGYLCMPTSCAVHDCITGLREIGCENISKALARALKRYPSADDVHEAVDVRQNYKLRRGAERRMAKDSQVFWDNADFFVANLAAFARSNRSNFDWVNNLDEGG